MKTVVEDLVEAGDEATVEIEVEGTVGTILEDKGGVSIIASEEGSGSCHQNISGRQGEALVPLE